MKKTFRKLMLIAAVALLAGGCVTGCADLNKKTYMGEYATAATGDASMRGYGAYWDKAIAHPEQFNRTATGLVAERATVSDLSIKLGVSIEMVEDLRLSAATNSAVKPSLTAAIQVMSANQSNMLYTVTQLLNTTTKSSTNQ